MITRISSKQTAARNKSLNDFYLVIIVILTITSIVLASLLIQKIKTTPPLVTGNQASLGAMTWDIKDGRATQKNSPHLSNLENLLVREGEKNLSKNCNPVYHQVKAYNQNETQVLLGYGCNSPTSQMFAIRTGDNWELVSPTNQFDNFGIPDCNYVDSLSIETSIAPVCQTHEIPNQPIYRVR